MIDQQLEDLITRHEGLKLKPYLDCCGKFWRECACQEKGKLSIGVGRNLDDAGLSADESITLRGNDIAKATTYAQSVFPWFSALSDARRGVVISLIFNLGSGGILEFKNFLKAMEGGDWVAARKELLDSHWASEVGDRAEELAKMVYTGTYDL